ncbi:LL-diaminopimelate aminotransferase [Cytobacillus pseudoceanisediminis]|uniref:LL-diaminopimelate aminotransferase n=1 Tax=Cytobacillus pseudoceanisediminis TaxID=3051614 RepID=UPI003C2B4FB2
MNSISIENLIADRIGGSSIFKKNDGYKFEKIIKNKAFALKNNLHLKLLDLGLGEPDSMAMKEVVDILSQEAYKKENRFYSDNGLSEFKKAAACYLENNFNTIPLDPNTEVNHCIGSKAALAQIPAAFINPGDISLVTVPGYPVLGTHTKWLGGQVVNLPLKKENNFLPDFNSLSDEIKRKAKLLYINYPNNPTGATATYEFYEKVVQFCKENQIICISDEAYAALTFSENEPMISFLSVPGAKEVGIVIHSLSKAYNMTGWRLGFVAGNENIVKAFAQVKSNYDSGQFIPIQKAGVYCLEHPEFSKKMAQKYHRRHELLGKVLKKIGFTVTEPKASFYQYVEAPKSIKNGPIFKTGEDFSDFLIKQKSISTVPWDDVGRYVRFSVTFEAESENEEKQVIQEIYERLGSLEFIW